MKLHENEIEFKQLVTLASSEFGIADVLIEKDYWVTFALRNLSKSGVAQKVVFKGGTSLSKAHKLIFRFSEDIDLAVIVEEGTSDNAVNKVLKAIEAACVTGFTAVTDDPRESKKGRFRKTIWKFPKTALTGSYGDAGENILIEVNSFTTPEPHADMEIDSLIAEYLKVSKQESIITEYNLEPFRIAVLRAERTFVEKISAITKGSHLSQDGSYEMLKKNIRHFYDLSKLFDKVGISILQDKAKLLELLTWVKRDDKKMDPKGEWADKEYKTASIYENFDEVWSKLSSSYNGQFKDMLYGKETLPKEDKVKETVLAIGKALKEYEE